MSGPRQRNLFEADPSAPHTLPWEQAAAQDRLVAQVVFNIPVDTVFQYLVPDGLRGTVGPAHRVKAPFGAGNRTMIGYCIAVGPAEPSKRRLKSLDAVLDPEPLLSPRMLELTRWISERYLCGWGQVLEAVIPAGVKRKSGTRIRTAFEVNAEAIEQMDQQLLPDKQKAILEVLAAAGRPLDAEELSRAAGCGSGPINTLRKKGLLRTVRQRTAVRDDESAPAILQNDLILNVDQARAVKMIVDALQSREHRTLLLHGVTGSGKTEVYIQAVREVVSYGRQAIILVPEISLTPQTIRRFRSRFPSVTVLHSNLSDVERHRHWRRIADGSVQVVVGARSAVFAPTPHLGLIVIDEEHESTFKQETVPRYHTREVARERARQEGIPLVLGSATPSLESWQRAQEGKDVLITLPNRIEMLPLPPVVIVDVTNDPRCSRGEGIGRALQSSMQTALRAGGQAILFLNLRGYAPVLWCRLCGNSVKCADCDVTLTWHRDRNVGLCHLCDRESPVTSECPQCHRAGIRFLGTGTQRLEQEVRDKFPDYRCLRMDSDSMRKPGSHDTALDLFQQGEVKILLGTQMIAKGLDFPNVTLVGVIDADTMLHQPDLRATERTFQLIAQVAGRTGRSHLGGRVLVQTASPDEPAILRASQHDYGGFAAGELVHRKAAFSPPWSRLARIIVRGLNEPEVRSMAGTVASTLRKFADLRKTQVRILGPAPAPIAKLKQNYRYHVQFAAADVETILAIWRETAVALPGSSGTEIGVDVDPVDMR